MTGTRITGAGWVDHGAFGQVVRERHVPYNPGGKLSEVARKWCFFAHPVKNFGRFDRTSKLTCCAVALALQDAGTAYGEGRRLPFGVLMTGPDGCLAANERYFRDYVESGRKLARGNLFIYTLPTSPAAEAAIHFGLGGPTLYLRSSLSGIAAAVAATERMARYGGTCAMLLVTATEEAALAIVVDTREGNRQICSADELRDAVRGTQRVRALVDSLTDLQAKGEAT